MNSPASFCGRCGAPLELASRSAARYAAAGSVNSPLIADIERYLTASAYARQCAIEWRRRVELLNQSGFGPHPIYIFERTEFFLDADNFSEIDSHFQKSLDEARAIYERWHEAAAKVDLTKASKENDSAWSAVDTIDVELLYCAAIGDLREALAMLRLIRETGWSGADRRDHAGAIGALESIIRFVEDLLFH